jgi:3-hydroxybutyryl-CoA dehydrogenase
MPIVILTDENLKKELLSDVKLPIEEVVWINDVSEFHEHRNADAFIDLLFQGSHIDTLEQLLPALVIINSVDHTLAETNTSFVRINAWPTFLKSPLIEAAIVEDSNRKKTETAFSFFNKKIEWLPDEIGFITPRVISMIINEAFMALEENISTKEEINTAMKAGTNYPYGPFEWAEKIGLNKIASLLLRLSREQGRYQPSSLLLQEAVSSAKI